MYTYTSNKLGQILGSNFLVFALIAFFLTVPQIASAAPTYTVSPLVVEAELEPRDIEQRVLTIKNTGTQPVSLFPIVNNISLDEAGGLEEFIPPSMSDRSSSLASWLEVSRAAIDLMPGDTTEVPLTIRVNLNAQPGTYHAMVSFAHGRNQDVANERVKSGNAPGAVITVRIEENSNSFLKLSGFFIDRVVTGEEDDTVTYTLDNPGDTQLIPKGDIIFYNGRGSEVGSIPVNPDGISLEPGEQVTLHANVPTEGLLGKYKGFLTVEYGDAQLASVHDTAFFYVIPWKQLLFLFLAVLVVVLFVSFLIHRRTREKHEYVDDDVNDLPMFVHGERRSEPRDHDIDLKK